MVGPGSAAVLRGERDVVLRKDRQTARGTRRTRGGEAGSQQGVFGATASVSDDDERLFQELRSLRSGIAKEASVPPYVVFHDKTLREMAARKPTTLDELSQVGGVGAAKLERYGERFLSVLTRGGSDVRPE